MVADTIANLFFSIVVLSIDQPAISPETAFSSPAFVTLNGASARATAPMCIPAPGVSAIVSAPSTLANAVADIVQPPISPWVAFIPKVSAAYSPISTFKLAPS